VKTIQPKSQESAPKEGNGPESGEPPLEQARPLKGRIHFSAAIAGLPVGVTAVALAALQPKVAVLLAGLAVLLGATGSGAGRAKVRYMGNAGLVLGLIGITAALILPQSTPSSWTPNTFEEPFVAWIGKEAPDFTLRDTEGNTWSLKELRGKRVFFAYWGTRCPPCIKEIPHFRSLVDSMPADSFQILGITTDPPPTLEHFTTVMDFNYPIISLATQREALITPYTKVRALPTLMVISPKGRFEAIRVGGLPDGQLAALAHGQA